MFIQTLNFQLSATSIDPNVASIIVGVTLLISSIVALVVVSKLNRKLMLLISMIGMAVCHIILAVCFLVDEQVGGIRNAHSKRIRVEVNTNASGVAIMSNKYELTVGNQ